MQVRSLGRDDPLEEGMATHSSILAWRIPWTERGLEVYSPWDHKQSDTTEVTQHVCMHIPSKYHLSSQRHRKTKSFNRVSCMRENQALFTVTPILIAVLYVILYSK